jgi:hypothetical protein
VPPSECLFWDGGSEFRCEDSLYDFVTLCVCENDINEAQPPVMWGTGNMQSGYVKEGGGRAATGAVDVVFHSSYASEKLLQIW